MRSCLSMISNMYDKLSYSERILADEALSHPESVVYMAIGELSEKLGIATSTIVATTKKFGFTGFKEFKIALASELINPTTPSFTRPAGSDDETTVEKVLKAELFGLEEAMKLVPQELFDKAAGILASAQRIYIIGIGTSAILARELHDYLFRLGLDCTYSEDHHQQLLVAKRLGPNDAAILISQSGVNKDIINIGVELKQHYANVIGISNFQNTPFAKCTDVLLAPFNTLTSFHENNFTLRIPMMAMMEALYYTLSELMMEKYSTSMEANNDVIRSTAITSTIKEEHQ